jgi:hypothetical protein
MVLTPRTYRDSEGSIPLKRRFQEMLRMYTARQFPMIQPTRPLGLDGVQMDRFIAIRLRMTEMHISVVLTVWVTELEI